MSDPSSSDYPNLLIGIGASAGGLAPLLEIIDHLSHGFQGALLIATHRPPNAPIEYPTILQRYTRLHVSAPVHSEKLSCAHVYIARPDMVLTVDGRSVHLEYDPERLRRLQRIDDLFTSIAENAGPNSVGVILSGALFDGIEGLKAIKAAGGTCMVQNPQDAVFKSMPLSALAAIDCDVIGTPLEIASHLIELAAGRRCH